MWRSEQSTILIYVALLNNKKNRMHHFRGMIILSRNWIVSVFAKETFELKFATALHLSLVFTYPENSLHNLVPQSLFHQLLSEESYDHVPSFSAVLAFTNRTCSLMSFVRFYWKVLKDFQLLGGILKINKTINDTVQIGTPPNSWIKSGPLSLSYRAGWLCNSSIPRHCCIVKLSCKSVPAIFS